MDRKDLVKKILELSLELKDAEGVQVMMCITDMVIAVKDYEKQLCLSGVSQQREMLEGFVDWFNVNDKTQAILSDRIEEYLKTL